MIPWTLRKIANCYLRGGFSVIPVRPDSKEPATSWRDYMFNHMNPNFIEEFFSSNSNIAVVTGKISNLTVIDVDDVQKFEGFYDFNALIESAKTVVKTPKGYHLWVSYDPDLKTKQVKDHGFDVKNDGALVNVPPSKINGHTYFFLKSDGLGSIPEDFKNKVLNLEKKTFSQNKLLNKVLEKLTIVRQLQDGTFRCFCPAHDDQEPSLDVGLRDGRLFIHCWAGCSREEIFQALGLETDEKKKEENTTQRLLRLVEGLELWVNQNGDEFVSIETKGYVRNLKIDSKEFRRYLQYLFFQKYGKPAHTQAILEAVQTLAGKALVEGKRYQSFVRVAKQDNFVELFLNNGVVARVDKDGISISNSICKFEQPHGLLPLPLPDLNATKDDWKFVSTFLNTDEHNLYLTIAWLIGCFNIDGEFPILNVVGEREGLGKTTVSRFLKSVIDPAVVNAKPLPKTEDDLLTVCLHNHVVAFDNISHITDSLSDAICRISTGSGIAKRRLFTDTDAVLYFVKNPVILNGIDLFAERRDLRRRCIHIELQKFTNPKPIVQLENEFRCIHSRILGWLIKAVQISLKEKITEPLDLTDMASFVEMVCKTEKSFPVSAKAFIEIFKANRHNVSIQTISENPIATTLLELVENEGEWRGTISELCEIIIQKFQNSYLKIAIPKEPRSLGKKLRRMLTDLEHLGLTCNFFRSSYNLSHVYIKKIEKFHSVHSDIPKPLTINNLQTGIFLERNGVKTAHSENIQEHKVLKNNDFGMNGVFGKKKSNFFNNDVIDGSDIDPDEIEVLDEG